MYHRFLIHSSADGHLGCFHVLAIYKQCYDEHWGTRVSFNSGFLGVFIFLPTIVHSGESICRLSVLPSHIRGQDLLLTCHFLLQGIFPTQGSNSGLLHCRQILYWLSYKGSPNSIYICVNTLYCFSFWLTSLCMIGSSFIHLIRTDSNAFFLIAE